MLQLDVIIVHFRAPERLASLLQSLRAWPGDIDRRITVVNNSSPETLRHLSMHGIRSLQTSANRGFAFAAQTALQGATSDRVLIIDPDVTLPAEGLFRLVRQLDDPAVAAVAPALAHPDGHALAYDPRWPRVPSRSWNWRSIAAHRLSPQDVDWLRASCLLVRRDAIQAIGGFDTRFFRFYADVDLCRRLERAGYRRVLDASVTATMAPHNGRSPVTTRFVARLRDEITYVHKHHPELWWTVYRRWYTRLLLRQMRAQGLRWVGSSRAMEAHRLVDAGLKALRSCEPRRARLTQRFSEMPLNVASLEDSSAEIRL